MFEKFAVWNVWLGKRMFLMVLVALTLGFFLNIHDSTTIRALVISLFAYMTFVTALSTSFREFLKILGRPWVPILILLLVHLITPLLAYGASYLFFPEDPLIRLGYIVGASIPIGVTSIIWTSLVKGNTAISLVAVTLDTLIIPIFLPLYFKLLIGQTIEIDYLKMVEELLIMITLPSIFGMALHDISERVAEFTKTIGGFSSKVAFFFVILLNASIVFPVITWNAVALKITLVTLLIVSFGYYIGYLGSFIIHKRNRPLVLTMIYNVGMRNIAFGIVLSVTFFPPDVAVPITLSMLFQQPIAAMIPYLYKKV